MKKFYCAIFPGWLTNVFSHFFHLFFLKKNYDLAARSVVVFLD